MNALDSARRTFDTELEGLRAVRGYSGPFAAPTQARRDAIADRVAVEGE